MQIFLTNRKVNTQILPYNGGLTGFDPTFSFQDEKVKPLLSGPWETPRATLTIFPAMYTDGPPLTTGRRGRACAGVQHSFLCDSSRYFLILNCSLGFGLQCLRGSLSFRGWLSLVLPLGQLCIDQREARSVFCSLLPNFGGQQLLIYRFSLCR